ncbi:MAG TPA: hypothetical protein VF167_08460 [Longimicrobiaceae bacterium]
MSADTSAPERAAMLEGIFSVPRSVETCPACGGSLTYQPDSWQQEEDGGYAVIGGMIACEYEDDWTTDEAHLEVNQMPYVYWLPVERKVLAWLNTERPEADHA